MEVKLKRVDADWRNVADVARTTIGKEEGNGEISSSWKRRMLLCEHSPIRLIRIQWKWINLKSWVSVHFVRHWLGITHWVKSQRNDRQSEYDRNSARQDTEVIHEAEANAQSIINISRKRLCSCASTETREAWIEFLNSFKDEEPELRSVCVKECIYRGFCPEFKSCNFYKTEQYKKELDEYRKNINS